MKVTPTSGTNRTPRPIKCTLKKRTAVPLIKKHQIVKEAYSDGNGIRATGRKYGVQSCQIRQWRKALEKLRVDIELYAIANPSSEESTELYDRKSIDTLLKAKRVSLTSDGRNNKFKKETVLHLRRYIDITRAENLTVSMRGCIIVVKKFDVSTKELTYKSISSRIYRLLGKWGISYRRRTHKAQRTRFNQEVVYDFINYFHDKIKMLNVRYEDVYNCDQTNVPYSMESSYTYAKKGSKSISIVGAETTNRVTVMLACNLDGKRKLDPYIIFTGSDKKTGRIRRDFNTKKDLDQNCEYGIQEKGWMDEVQMLRWIEIVWKPHVATINRLTFLLLDENASHMTTKVRKAFEMCNTEIEIIPGGYTSQLQALDVGINKPFKNYIRREFDEWLMHNLHLPLKPSRLNVSNWVSKAYADVKQSTIINSFRKIGYLGLDKCERKKVVTKENELDRIDISFLKKRIIKPKVSYDTNDDDLDSIYSNEHRIDIAFINNRVQETIVFDETNDLDSLYSIEQDKLGLF